MAKITVTKLLRTDAIGVCGTCVTLVFYKDGKRVHEEVFSGKISESAYVRTVELPEHDMVKVDLGECGVEFAYSIDYSVSWNGEGLPPVGLEVEVCDSDEPHEAYAKHIGEKVKIIAHDVLNGDDEGLPVAVYSYDCSWGKGYHALVAGKFRPIRTAEQIAAEERVKAIDEMTGSGIAGGLAPWVCAELYDAGYRKVEQ